MSALQQVSNDGLAPVVEKLLNDEEMLTFAAVYPRRVKEGEAPFEENISVAAGTGTAGGDAFVRLAPDVPDRFGEAVSADAVPVLIERPEHYAEPGGHVLYLNGAVRFLTYPGPWPMTQTTIETLRDLDARGGG